MAFVEGNSIKISVGEVVVGGQQDCTLNRGTSTTDSTTKDSGPWEEAEASGLNWSAELSGLIVVSDEGLQAIKTAWSGLQTVDIKYGDTKAWEEGKAIIEAFSENSAMKEKTTYSVTLKGVGELTPKTAGALAEKSKK